MDRPCTKVALRCAAVLFTVFIVACVAVGITLIFTQKPVDLAASSSPRQGPSAEGLDSSTTAGDASQEARTTLTMRSRKKFPSNYRKFTFDDLVSPAPIVANFYHKAWMPDGSGLLNQQHLPVSDVDPIVPESDTLMIIPPGSTEEQVFIDRDQFPKGYGSDRIKFSSNGKYAAIFKNVHQGFRYSKDAIYKIVRVSNGKLRNMVNVGPSGNGSEIIQEFSWNPNPTLNSFVFVSDKTLYYQEDPESNGTAFAISSNGSDYVSYGITDWLYEEDVFANSLAHWWSPSGAYLSSMKFDDQEVSKIFLHKYQSGVQYPEYKAIPYPKAGVSEQPRVKLYLWDRAVNRKMVISPPMELANQSYYVFGVTWIRESEGRPEQLISVWSNRRQDTVYFLSCGVKECIPTFVQPFTMEGRRLWAEPKELQMFASSTGFYTLLPVKYIDGNIYNHVAHIALDGEGAGRVEATHGGPYDVHEILAYDTDTDTIVYRAMGGGIASMRLYKVENASKKNATVECLSRSLKNCDSMEASLSPNGKRAFVTCRNAFKNYRLFLMDMSSPLDAVQLRGQAEANLTFDPPTIVHETMRLPSGIDAHVGLIFPPKMDKTLKYPMMLNVYAGPNSYANNMDTPWDFLIYLSSSELMIIAIVDGRGSANRGWNIKEPVVESLSGPEVEDQILAVKELTQKYDFIDANAVTVFGWSYGGFVSTHVAIADGGKNFRCSIAVAPVADFALYDSAYTERYLGFPAENAAGYNASRLVDKMERLTNVSYLLAHGEADDNVHYQHSALLAQSLQAHNIHFTQLVYTNQDHTMASVRHHLYKEFVQFLGQNCLGQRK